MSKSVCCNGGKVAMQTSIQTVAMEAKCNETQFDSSVMNTCLEVNLGFFFLSNKLFYLHIYIVTPNYIQL